MHFSSFQAGSIAAVLLPLAYAIPLDSPSEFIKNLTPRDLQSAVQGLPACNTKDTDPTWAVGVSHWKDGEGHSIGSDCDNNAGGDNHCWTDYFLVGTTNAYNDWYQAVGNIGCDGDCHEDVGTLAQSCTTVDWSVSHTISTGFDIGFEIGGSTTVSIGGSRQTCNTQSDTSSCRWTDNNCHSIWAAEQITTVHGYKRRSCNSPASAAGVNMPNTSARPDGYFTRGMQDFEVKMPAISAIDCKGTCDPMWSPGQLPSIDGSLHPMN